MTYDTEFILDLIERKQIAQTKPIVHSPIHSMHVYERPFDTSPQEMARRLISIVFHPK